MQYADQPFYTAYPVKPGDTLFGIGKSRGFDNPGPILAYPPNSALFAQRFGPAFLQTSRDFRLTVGDNIRIPWNPTTLQKTIATSEFLATEVAADTRRLVQEQIHTKEEMDSLLFKIDAANFLANMATSVGGLARAYAANSFELAESKVVEWFTENRVTVMAANVTTLAVPAPSAPKRDIANFVIRHTLGPWNPSFWVGVYAAIQSGDIDYYLYGNEAVTAKTIQRIDQQSRREIAQLQARASAARRQLMAPFYRHRI